MSTLKEVIGTAVAAAVVVTIATVPVVAGSTDAYLKIPTIKGESGKSQVPPGGPGSVQGPQQRPQGLLLPAVQKVREAAPRNQQSGVNVAVGDVNGDGAAATGNHIKDAKLATRKARGDQ